MEIFAMCTQRIFLQICSEIILKIGLHLPKLLIFLSNIKGLVFWNTVYNNTVIGTVAVDGWAVTFGTARRGLDGLRPHPSPRSTFAKIINFFIKHQGACFLEHGVQQYGDWYSGRRWVGCYIWYSEKGPGRAAAPSIPSSL